MPRKYSSARSVTSITYWRKFAEHRLFYILMAGIFGFGIIAYFGMGQSGGGASQAAREQRGQETIATVNGEPITRGAYDRQIEQYKRFMGGSGDLQALSMQGMVLNGLIDTAVAKSAAKARGLKVTDQQIDQSIADFKKQLAGGNKMSDDEFNERLGAMGLTMNELRDQERESLLPKTLADTMKKPAPPVTEADLIKSYNEVKLRHILVDNKKMPDEQAKTKAQKIYEEAKSGKDFATLANKYTDDPGNMKPGKFDPKTKKMGPSTPQGGLYDWQSVKTYVTEFGNAAMALKPGEISQPVKTQFGYHVIKLEGIRAKLPKDFEKDKAKLLADYKKEMEQRQAGEAQGEVKKLIDAEKTKAKIVWQDPSLEWRYEYGAAHPMMQMPQPEKPDFMNRLKAYAAKHPEDSAADFVLGQQAYTRYALAKPGADKDTARKEVIGYYEAGLKGSEDQQIRLTLAQLYRDDKNDAKALEHYQKLQRMLSWDDSTGAKATHMQLEKAFKELGHPDLAEKETKKIALLTEQEKKEAEERKRQAEEQKKATDANKGKGGDVKLPPGGSTHVLGSGSFTVGGPSNKPEQKKPDAKKDEKPAASTPNSGKQ